MISTTCAAISPLARASDTDPSITERFELYISGREVANGFSELNDAEDQAARFAAQAGHKDGGDDEAMYYDADFVREWTNAADDVDGTSVWDLLAARCAQFRPEVAEGITGVPADAIFGEDRAHNTLDSLRSVAAEMSDRDLRSAVFVSDPTHMLRVLTIASDLGIEAHGSPTRTSRVAGSIASRPIRVGPCRSPARRSRSFSIRTCSSSRKHGLTR